jgi:predicted small lipoprotein YifL
MYKKIFIRKILIVVFLSLIVASCGVKGDIDLDQDQNINRNTILDKLI